MKRLIALLLSLVMICGMLAACGDDTGNGTTNKGGKSDAIDFNNFKNTDIYSP